MRRLFLSKKTGFKNLSLFTPIIIRDYRGILFYTTEGLNPVEKFNLPAGEYFVDSGAFSPMTKPVNYKLVRLPARERFSYPKPYNFKVMFGNNPNKCSVIWDLKTILFDESLRERPLYVLDFILFHEFSHSSYGTEKYADLMAGNYMKRKGYNPSQIGYAPLDTLSRFADPRKELMVKKLIQYNAKD